MRLVISRRQQGPNRLASRPPPSLRSHRDPTSGVLVLSPSFQRRKVVDWCARANRQSVWITAPDWRDFEMRAGSEGRHLGS